MRRDTSKLQNRLWLLRNLRIRNGKHPEFNRVITELKGKTEMTKKIKKVEPNDVIHQFVVKNVNGCKRRVGILVGKRVGNTVKIGWSRANAKRGDKFDREMGMKLAIERTKADETVPMPHSMAGEAYDFRHRCIRYFKDASSISKIAVQPISVEETED